MNTRTLMAAVLSAAAMASAGAATAAEDVMIVRVGDLNLESHQGASTALRRIRNAAAMFCAPDTGPATITRRELRKSCTARLTAKAVTTLDAPQVTALYAPGTSVLLAQR